MLNIKRIHSLTALFLAIVAAAFPARADDGQGMEHAIKAAMIYNMAKFVDWPQGAADPGGEFVICVIGEGPLCKAVESLDGKTIKDIVVRVRKADGADEARGCRIAVMGDFDSARLESLLRALGDSPTLTISDMDGFVERGGDIGLIIVDNKVRFEINNGSASRKNLKVSSKLLKLADKVVDEGRLL